MKRLVVAFLFALVMVGNMGLGGCHPDPDDPNNPYHHQQK
jgi:hypothetical protein